MQINENAKIYEVTEITSKEKYGDNTVTSVRSVESEEYTFEEYFKSYLGEKSKEEKDIYIPINVYLGSDVEIWSLKVLDDVYEDEWVKP